MGVFEVLKRYTIAPLPPPPELPPPKGIIRQAAQASLREAGEFVRDLTADHGHPVVEKIVRNLRLVSQNGHSLNGKAES